MTTDKPARACKTSPVPNSQAKAGNFTPVAGGLDGQIDRLDT